VSVLVNWHVDTGIISNLGKTSTMIDDKKRKIVYLIIIIATAALVLAILAPTALSQEDILVPQGSQALAVRTAFNQCSENLVKTQILANLTYSQCFDSYIRLNRLADGYKFYVTTAFITSVLLNIGLVYVLLKMMLKNKAGG